MDLQNVWTVAAKDLKIFRKKRNVIYTTMLSPLLLGVALSLAVGSAGAKTVGTPAAGLLTNLNALPFIFITFAAMLPTAIASYSIVGEKVQKSLEPLLATPVTDGEVLLGKIISSFLPPILAIYAGAAVFMALIDQETYGVLGYLYFPNLSIGIILLVVAPLASLSCVEMIVILSARMSDVRAVQQLGGLIVLPFVGIFAAAETKFLSLDTNSLLTISALILTVDVILFFLSKASFRREEILTKWK